MRIDRESFLLGLVLGLALATVTVAVSIMFAPKSPLAIAAAQTALASPAATMTRVPPSPTATPVPPSPRTATPQPPATPSRPAPTASFEPPRTQSVDVPPRRNVQVSIPVSAGQLLDLAILLESDIDLTISDPSGTTVYGPTRVRRSYTALLSSPTNGNFVLKLDNSFSIISTKQVLVQYRLLR